MNSTSYLPIQKNYDAYVGASAVSRVTIRLKNTKELLASIEDKIELAKEQIKKSHNFISYSKKHFEKENEIINNCLERLNSLEILSKDNAVVKKYLNGNHAGAGNLTVAENNLLQNALDKVSIEINSETLRTPDQYMEIDLDNRAETTFWCKKLNASRLEILYAMEQIKNKCWVQVWKYFLNNNKRVTAIPVNGTKPVIVKPLVQYPS